MYITSNTYYMNDWLATENTNGAEHCCMCFIVIFISYLIFDGQVIYVPLNSFLLPLNNPCVKDFAGKIIQVTSHNRRLGKWLVRATF